jgi:hypothetical protein
MQMFPLELFFSGIVFRKGVSRDGGEIFVAIVLTATMAVPTANTQVFESSR